MSAHFSDEDEGKRVVNANGDEIGMIQTVSGGQAHVDPDPDMTDTIKSKLGWGDADEETYALDADDVEEIGDDEIHLRQF
ncbi:MAG: PRC-barrel domain containing protein [Halobacteriota archaeon]